MFEAMGTCRAMRHLKPDPVPADLVERLMWAATRAPEPGQQPGMGLRGRRRPRPQARIAHAVRTAMAQRVAAMPRPDRTMRLMLDGTAKLIDTLDQAPLIIFVTGPVIYPPGAPSEQFTWSALYPAAQNILLAARALGWERRSPRCTTRRNRRCARCSAARDHQDRGHHPRRLARRRIRSGEPSPRRRLHSSQPLGRRQTCRRRRGSQLTRPHATTAPVEGAPRRPCRRRAGLVR